LSLTEHINAPNLPLRPCVGIMLLNSRGKAWIGQRRPRWIPADAESIWQMPQGGILPGENPLTAALRELKEETGVSSVEVLAEMPEWLTYRLPPHLLGVALKRRYAGQCQRWFAMRFTGEDSEITLIPQAGGKAEFSAWRWATLKELPGLALPFKRPIYEAVISEFADLTR
jgi:putative (di)nucleoside polyphosphate hydrolase